MMIDPEELYAFEWAFVGVATVGGFLVSIEIREILDRKNYDEAMRNEITEEQ
jgi:hypothetical protein